MASVVEGEIVVRLTVNGEERRGIAEPRMLLSDFLRGELGLTGTHVGCEQGVCGSCTVRVDGELVRSCLVFAVQAQGSSVETVEGLREAGLTVSNAVILIDREQGAARRLEAMGVRVQCMLSLDTLLTYLNSAGLVSRDDYDRSTAYLHREDEPRSEFD